MKALKALLEEQSLSMQDFPAVPSTPGKILSCGKEEDSIPSSGDSKPSVSGQAFFINDAKPVSHYDYFQPLFEGLGYSFPAITLPLWVILIVAYFQAGIYCLVHKFFSFSPFVTPAEAYKSGVTHYFSCRKAMVAFGYSPTRPNDLKQMVEYYRARGCTNKMRFSNHCSHSKLTGNRNRG